MPGLIMLMKRVLFVDGDTVALEQLRQELQTHHQDWQEELTDNGHQAWELFQANPFDAVVTSRRVGELSGEELLDRPFLDKLGLNERFAQWRELISKNTF
jgi:DNA-binding NtrC family response regulator